MGQKQMYEACLEALNGIKDFDDYVNEYCMTKSTFAGLLDAGKKPAKDGTIVYLVEDYKDLPTSVAQWMKLREHCTVYAEISDGEWVIHTSFD